MPHKTITGKNTRVSYSKIMEAETTIDGKKNKENLFMPPDLLKVQKDSFKSFIEKGLFDTFMDYTPIKTVHKKLGITNVSFMSYEINTGDEVYNSATGVYKNLPKAVLKDLENETKTSKDFEEEGISVPNHNETEAKENDATYDAPLFVETVLEMESGNILKEKINFGRIPLMTKRGTFIYNGAERVIISQLGKSPGAFFDKDFAGPEGFEKEVYSARLSPYRGTWLEFETGVTKNKNDIDVKKRYYVRLDKTKKILLSTFLKALEYDETEILEIFDHDEIIRGTLESDNTKSSGEAAVEIYNKLRQNQKIPQKDAIKFIRGLFFDRRRYDIGEVGRYKFNKKLSLSELITGKTISKKDHIADPKTGEIIAKKGSVLDRETAEKIEKAGINIAYISITNLDGEEEDVKVHGNGFEKININDHFKSSIKELEDPYYPDKLHRKTFDEIMESEVLKKLAAKKDLTRSEELKVIKIFDEFKYKLIGRYLHEDDVIASIAYMINLSKGFGEIDDRDHLGNRRVKSVGELLQEQFRIGMSRIEKGLREKLTAPEAQLSAHIPINKKPLESALREFFGSSQLSQFMDENNPLSEMTNKRRVSALGPGGLTRERAGFEVRDVHYSHYGRICPIETPEGQNIGLIGSLTTYAKINDLGFIETPYKKVVDGVVTKNVKYYSADEEEDLIVAQANEPLDSSGQFLNKRVACRGVGGKIELFPRDKVDLMDVSPKQVVSVATALIPFLENDDANRALMGANMQRQAVPLLVTDAPRVATGIEWIAAKDSGITQIARKSGEVSYVSSDVIKVKNDAGKEDSYDLLKFRRTNQGTTINQKPIVFVGEKVKEGEVIADGPATSNGEFALGKNLLVGFMTYEGYNYEDAIILNERLVRDDVLTSIHIEKHDVVARETKLGDEEITRDIPNAKDSLLNLLSEDGIISVGAEVKAGDILVGKITPKGEKEVSPEEKLLRSIFGVKAKDVKDTSLRVPNGGDGIVLEVKEYKEDLPLSVRKKFRVYIARKRKIEVGDKMAGRHGNKGVVSTILPEEEMPFLEDGRSLEVMLNPLGVPSRMNIGQILEVHLGLVARERNWYVSTPVFDGATEKDIIKELTDCGLPETGKLNLRDGRNGEYFVKPITVGDMYMLKLHHLVADKIHARSTGPYSIITQQPLGGKAQKGGQRFGEMEVWALEAYGAAYTLKEILTVKSDDMIGRNKTLDALQKGKNPEITGVPESFKVLIKELQALGIDTRLENKRGEETQFVSGWDKENESKIEKFLAVAEDNNPEDNDIEEVVTKAPKPKKKEA